MTTQQTSSLNHATKLRPQVSLRRHGQADALGVSSFAAMITAAQAAIESSTHIDPQALHQDTTDFPPSYPPRGVLAGGAGLLPGGDLTLGHGASGMSLEHLSSQQRLQYGFRRNATPDSYGGDSGFETASGSPSMAYANVPADAMGGVGSTWAWGGPSPGPVAVPGQDGKPPLHYAAASSPPAGSTGSPSVSHQSSGGMAWGSPAPGATSAAWGGSGGGGSSRQGMGSSGGDGGRGRIRQRTTEGEPPSSPTTGGKPAGQSYLPCIATLDVFDDAPACDVATSFLFLPVADQAILVVGLSGGSSSIKELPQKGSAFRRSSSPPAAAALRRSPVSYTHLQPTRPY